MLYVNKYSAVCNIDFNTVYNYIKKYISATPMHVC